MASPQATANLLMAGGSLGKTGKKTVLCKAFKRAARRWCDGEGKGNRKFNDFFFEELRKAPPAGDPSLAATLGREGGALFRDSRFVGFVSNVAGNARFPVAGPIASAMQASVSTCLQGIGYGGATAATGWLASAGRSGVDATRFAQLRSTWGVPGGGNYNYRFLDGQFADGRVLEIKGPADYYQDPGEATDQIKAGKGEKPAVVSCKSCGASACQNMTTTSSGMKVWRCS